VSEDAWPDDALQATEINLNAIPGLRSGGPRPFVNQKSTQPGEFNEKTVDVATLPEGFVVLVRRLGVAIIAIGVLTLLAVGYGIYVVTSEAEHTRLAIHHKGD